MWRDAEHSVTAGCLQILNTSGEPKTGPYIAAVCKQLITTLHGHSPSTVVAGFIMDSASANRNAMDVLDRDCTVTSMVNLQCAAHMISLLMKDLAKRFGWVEHIYTQVLFISAAINGSEKLRYLFQQQCLQGGSACCTIATHCDTRFCSRFLVALSVERRLDDLVCLVGSAKFLELLKGDDNEAAAKLHKMLLGQFGDRDGVVKRLPILKKLCSTIAQALTQVEADKASLSRMRALVRKLEAHAEWFYQTHGDLCDGVIKKRGRNNVVTETPTTLRETFHSRLRDFYYKPSITAAFLLDPINFRMTECGTIDLPFEVLDLDEENEACADIERLADNQSVAVTKELADMKLNGIAGLSDLNLRVVRECMLVTEKDMPGGAVQRTAAPVHKRMKCWEKVLSSEYPQLAKVAAKYLAMHSTSCASERNLSVFGRLFDKLRGKLHLSRGEKMVYLAVNDRMKKGDLDASKEEVPFFYDEADDEGEGGDDVSVGGEVMDVVGADGD
jgi:hAT family C-terminal dimerisation region